MAEINLEANTAQIRVEPDPTPGGPQMAPAPDPRTTRDLSGEITGNNRLFVLGQVADNVEVTVNGESVPNGGDVYNLTKNEAGTVILSFNNPPVPGTQVQVTTEPAQQQAPQQAQQPQPAQEGQEVGQQQPTQFPGDPVPVQPGPFEPSQNPQPPTVAVPQNTGTPATRAPAGSDVPVVTPLGNAPDVTTAPATPVQTDPNNQPLAGGQTQVGATLNGGTNNGR